MDPLVYESSSYYLQVDAFLEAHESGLTEAERELAKGE